MALKGKKPDSTQKRLKVFFYGQAGVGKTTAALGFPKPYLIDTERGAENDQYVKLINEKGGAYFFTTDPDALIEEIKELLKEKHDYKTLIIDPLTVIYNDLLDKYADEVGTEFAKHKQPANRRIKHLFSLLLRLDMNVIITSHAKAKWVRGKDGKGKDTVTEEGYTYDCYDKLDYLFDLVVEVQKRGKSRMGVVKKSRIQAFQDEESFAFSYDAIADKYGREVLERDAMVQELATHEQVSELLYLIGTLKISADVQEKWLDKAHSESWDEMPKDVIQKCIEHLKNSINKPKEVTSE